MKPSGNKIGRVYAESKHGYYFSVLVFDTLKEMRAYASRTTKNSKPYFRPALAATLATGRFQVKELGQFCFYRGHLGTEIIAHEATHGAMRWCEAKNLPLINRESPNYRLGRACDAEERFCCAVGHLASQMATMFYDSGFYDNEINDWVSGNK